MFGALQVGFLKVLLTSGLRPDLIVGTSVGALNGAFIAFYPDEEGIERLQSVWRAVKMGTLFHHNLPRMAFCAASKRVCVYTNDYLRRIIAQHMPADDFAATRVPLLVTCTDLVSGTKVVLSHGPVSTALLATTAVPGLFSPIPLGTSLLVDGAVVANLDIDTAVDAGCTHVLAVDATPPLPAEFPAHILGVLMRSAEVMLRHQMQRDIYRHLPRGTITVVRLGQFISQALGVRRNPRELLALGEEAGCRLVPRLVGAGGGLSPGLFGEDGA
jgi:NTE family protein